MSMYNCPHCHSRLSKSRPSVCSKCSRDVPPETYNIAWYDHNLATPLGGIVILLIIDAFFLLSEALFPNLLNENLRLSFLWILVASVFLIPLFVFWAFIVNWMND
jgi:hypothetical protein